MSAPVARALAVAGADVPGCTAIVIRDDRVDVSCAGVRSIATGDPVTEDTVFHLASISKIFTALTVLRLVEQGHIDLDGTMEAQVAGLHFDDRRGAAITVRQVLMHVTGLPDNYRWSWPEIRHDDDAWRAVVTAANHTALIDDPGRTHHYSSIAYDLLGGLVACVTERPFEDIVHDMVLAPLQMDGSSLHAPVVADRLAAPHVPHTFDPATFSTAPVLVPRPGDRPVQIDEFPHNRARAVGGNVLASGRDVGRFLVAALQRFPQLISDATFHAMSTRAVTTGRAEPWYGLGLRIGEHSFGHGGLELGFRCGLQWFPARREAVCILTNYFHGATLDMMQAALQQR